MKVSVSISFENGKIVFDNGETKKIRKKGNSLLKTPDEFCVIDLETTGLDPEYDEIIEMSAISVSDGKIINSFSKLVKPSEPISEFITELTGITNEMLEGQENINTVLPEFLDFIGNKLVVGHNVNFDINFIYDNALDVIGTPFTSDFVDTMRLARRVLPDLKHHRLKDLVKEFHIEQTIEHRALYDCKATIEVLNNLNRIAAEKNIDLSTNIHKKHLKAADISTSNVDFDESHPLYGKCCVFTGTLAKMTRKEAMQIVVDLGGKCADNVTSKVDYLILGCFDYSSGVKGNKSTKLKKAEDMILKGKDITILSENVFYDMIGENV